MAYVFNSLNIVSGTHMFIYFKYVTLMFALGYVRALK